MQTVLVCMSRTTNHAITCSTTEISQQALDVYVMLQWPAVDRHRQTNFKPAGVRIT